MATSKGEHNLERKLKYIHNLVTVNGKNVTWARNTGVRESMNMNMEGKYSACLLHFVMVILVIHESIKCSASKGECNHSAQLIQAKKRRQILALL